MRATIERLRARPEHVRKQVALGVSGGVAGLVLVGWVVAMSAGGAFDLDTTPAPGTATFAQANDELAAAVASGGRNFFGGSSTPSSLSIVNEDSSTTYKPHVTAPEDRTVIPF